MEQKKSTLLKNQSRALKLLGIYTAVVLLIFAIIIPFLETKIDKQQEKVAETFVPQDNVPKEEKDDSTPVPVTPAKSSVSKTSDPGLRTPDSELGSDHSIAVVDLKKIIWPIKADVVQQFGMVYSRTYNDYRFHNGIDIKVNRGSEIVSILPGKVIKVETTGSEVKTILVEHGSGWQSEYAQLENSFVKAGTLVKSGQVLGSVGQPGLSEVLDGPHLHFSLIKNGQEVNPLEYLPQQ